MIQSLNIQGNIHANPAKYQHCTLDTLEIEWFDAEKRIIRAITKANREIGFRNTNGVALTNGDVLYCDDQLCIVICILPCKCLIFKPSNYLEAANVCFEIGNRHLPILINNQPEIVIVYEKSLHPIFLHKGFKPEIEERVFQQAITLKIHEWNLKSKSKVTLSKNIHESFIDPAAN